MLDYSIEQTYAARSTATNKNSLYDSYVRAIRWASNRLHASPDGGVIGLVTNGGWLDGKSADGIRESLTTDFHHIYVFNLRGNARTSGELRKQEGDGVFNQGSRSTVAITLLVKRPGDVPKTGGQIHYRDIGDYRTREDKLAIIADSTIDGVPWEHITPNDSADWINQRDDRYADLVPLFGTPDAIFTVASSGLQTNRDAWVYSSSRSQLVQTVERMVDTFNDQVSIFEQTHRASGSSLKSRADMARGLADLDPRHFSWDRSDFTRMARGERLKFEDQMVRVGQYRPFMKQHVAVDRTLNKETSQIRRLFPDAEAQNLVIAIQQTGPAPFFVLATSHVSDLVLCGAGNATVLAARWRYEDRADDATLFDPADVGRSSNLNLRGVQRFRDALGADISDNDVFCYVYGILHSPEFRQTFEANLNKEAPRVPLVESREVFDAFAEAGQKLCDLHVDYETADPYPLIEEWADGVEPDRNPDVLRVGARKMRYPKVADPDTGKKVNDKTRLVYNDYLTLTSIPIEAHDYVLGTRSGIDWIIDRWYVKTDKASGIVNDVNQWGLERGEPRYIIDLVKRVVTVSVRTVEIVNGLPRLSF